MMKSLIGSAFALAVIGMSAPADAGRGATQGQVQGAIDRGGVDNIISTLEKAENLIATPRTVAAVMGLLDHEDFRAREVAAWWFARRPHLKAELHDLAVADLALGDSTKARNAADILGTFRHPKALTALTDAMTRTGLSAEARAHVALAIGTIGHPSGQAALVDGLAAAEAEVRLASVHAWNSLRFQDTAAPVIPLVTDSDVAVRRAAAKVIGRIKDASARAQLETALRSDSDALVRRNAAYALGRIGDAASRDALVAARDNDTSALVRSYARTAVRMVGF